LAPASTFGSHGGAVFRLRAGVPALALVAALGACSTDEGPPPPCPPVALVTGAESLVRFDQGGQDLTDVLFEAAVMDTALRCEYVGDVIEADMRISIEAARGPADAGRLAKFSYFVAIATLDRQILAREEFAMEVPFPGNQTRIAAVEEVSQRIPLRAGENGDDYVIYVGLALTPRELRYNLQNR